MLELKGRDGSKGRNGHEGMSSSLTFVRQVHADLNIERLPAGPRITLPLHDAYCDARRYATLCSCPRVPPSFSSSCPQFVAIFVFRDVRHLNSERRVESYVISQQSDCWEQVIHRHTDIDRTGRPCALDPCSGPDDSQFSGCGMCLRYF